MFKLIDLYGWYFILTPELLVVAVWGLLYAKAGGIEPSIEGICCSTMDPSSVVLSPE
ncbi:hypothetical protein [Paenibacillus taichungensis]|uniref:hypothetical protein n=1 Tax=Paenibacillus taichungensis TaxID=484184 RepID=UPI002870F0B3|nr:hypothetical protein [Paenibacillus taichungensis]MDR9748588.1 hypothetical protein [Paenibacillus taichungensis]